MGEIENGKPNGQGIYNQRNVVKYESEWKDGKNMVMDHLFI